LSGFAIVQVADPDDESVVLPDLDDWLDLVPPDDLPERDVNEDLGIAPTHNQAFREAEKVFARIGNTSEPVEAEEDLVVTL